MDQSGFTGGLWYAAVALVSGRDSEARDPPPISDLRLLTSDLCFPGKESELPQRSAGLLMFRRHRGAVEVFLVHPGGPFWAKKDTGAWSIPKGELEPTEDPLTTARREFFEETGFTAAGEFHALAPVKVSAGKIVEAWFFEGNLDPTELQSNTFSLEWPPHSGSIRHFPEVDRGAWFGLCEARTKLVKGQVPLIDELEQRLTG